MLTSTSSWSGDFDETRRAMLIAEIKETADKLERDHATMGDLKILSRSLRELRYAFKVFTPYRRIRKASVPRGLLWITRTFNCLSISVARWPQTGGWW
jgi:hypothetical protein